MFADVEIFALLAQGNVDDLPFVSCWRAQVVPGTVHSFDPEWILFGIRGSKNLVIMCYPIVLVLQWVMKWRCKTFLSTVSEALYDCGLSNSCNSVEENPQSNGQKLPSHQPDVNLDIPLMVGYSWLSSHRFHSSTVGSICSRWVQHTSYPQSWAVPKMSALVLLVHQCLLLTIVLTLSASVCDIRSVLCVPYAAVQNFSVLW